MKKHSLKDWLIAVRPWSFPASAMPVIVTLAYLYWAYGVIDWKNGVLALVGIIIFHASGNAWSDYFDFERGVDRADTFGVKTLTSGQFMPLEIRNLAIGLMVPAVAIGLWLVVRTGLPLLWVGVCGAICSLLYPWLKYRAFGDFVIFVAYAILPTLGISYITVGKFLPDLLLIIVPVGLITVAILHANNTRDIETDVRAKISTLAMKLGKKTDVLLYIFEVIFPFLWIVGCVVLGYFPWWSLLTMLGLLPAIANARAMLRLPKEGISAISNLDEKTAKLQLLFSLLFTVTFLI
ncbi:prenyltransferase [Bacteroides stercorirosoris]|jgi:1,4-dihydroxy-2-naphthoate octaprenyltransferase|uniref:Prenyltransferase n=1 Tax=Bacteroides stercorirosoris TaxID=871324 RepID=A0A413H431_9BACE|nr:prenyltransferase [Bacteroides stercorirosoris]OKZ09624.1 MAG: 1,4-dihydroxy-2-naphthoate prenyltransferase [Bacteroides oleiciplenus]RGX78150.1 prenyltransferase [Bacteroides stercorirosoris]